jgi:hypothetical protein
MEGLGVSEEGWEAISAIGYQKTSKLFRRPFAWRGSNLRANSSNDPFLNGDGMSGSPMSFSSMKGLNSYRSPNALRPIPLSSNNRAFSNWTKEQFGVDKKEAEFVSGTAAQKILFADHLR